jgi:hypothetical protein
MKEALRKAAEEYRREAEEPNGMYALFRDKTQLGKTYASEKEVWEAALTEGLVTDIPVADGAGGQVLPIGYHSKWRSNTTLSLTGSFRKRFPDR